MNNRSLKDLLYEQVARIGKAVSSPKRLELLELLAQSEKSVEVLAGELSVDMKLASAHLKTLKEARLVESRREGKYVVYRLSGTDVAALWVMLRQVAEQHLLELKLALERVVSDPAQLASVGRQDLLDKARHGRLSSSTCARGPSIRWPTFPSPGRCLWPRSNSGWLTFLLTRRLSPIAVARSA